jgi:hypothetical protein
MKKFNKYLDNGIEILFEQKNESEEARPIKISINKNIFDKIPNSELIRKAMIEKFGFAVSYNEHFDSTTNYWETSISSCIIARKIK